MMPAISPIPLSTAVERFFLFSSSVEPGKADVWDGEKRGGDSPPLELQLVGGALPSACQGIGGSSVVKSGDCRDTLGRGAEGTEASELSEPRHLLTSIKHCERQQDYCCGQQQPHLQEEQRCNWGWAWQRGQTQAPRLCPCGRSSCPRHTPRWMRKKPAVALVKSVKTATPILAASTLSLPSR